MIVLLWPLGAQGGFLDNHFHGEGGTYNWSNGGAQVGACWAGELHGRGLHRFRDGRAEYVSYEEGWAMEEGVGWSTNRQSAYKTVEGQKWGELLLAEADQRRVEGFSYW